jgi:hypothetical protein
MAGALPYPWLILAEFRGNCLCGFFGIRSLDHACFCASDGVYDKEKWILMTKITLFLPGIALPAQEP